MKKNTLLNKIIVVFLFVATQFSTLSAQQVYINEFLASNSNTNVDELGEDDDWIELYNSSSSSVDIGGMFLTDNLINTTKWAIPGGTTIPANGFLLFWCDDQASQGPLHTNFKLSSGGESIALVANDGTTIIDSYTYGPQTANVSEGRQSDGSSPWIFFGQPTPDETNGNGSTLAAMPVASQIGGHYNSDITISLTTTTPGATIRYTLDGSEPTSASSAYGNPLDVEETTVLRARAYKSGVDPSRIMTHTYLYNIDHTMPIFCVSTDHDNFFGDDGIYTLWDDDIEKPAHVELYEADGSFGFRQDLGVQVHGGFSQSYPHKGISFIAKNQYGNNKINYPLFPDLPFTQYGSFILRASGNDWSKLLFRDALASGLAREFEDVDPMIKDPDLEFQEYRPAIVYLNGEYFGIHNLREKLDWRYLKTHYGIEKEEADIVQKEDGLEHGNLDAWTSYREFIEDADFTDENDLAELKTWIDLDHFVDYFLINIYVDNNDWPDNNNKGWRLRQNGERWRYFLYDMDRGLGLIPLSGDYNSGDWDSRSLEMVMADTKTEDHNSEWSTLLLRKLMENDAFKLKFINRMADQLNIMYTPSRVLGRLDEYEAIYEVEIDQHAEKWWDTNYYGTNVNRARIFAANREEEMWDQFDDFYEEITGLAELEVDASPQAGGVIHLNTMNFRELNFPWLGKYFEGVDVPLYAVPNPGYIFTGWSPSALGNEAITTMNLSGNEEITANFVLGSTQVGNIIINEINYHSPDTSICNAGDWVELYNIGQDPVDVSGWFLEDGSGNYFNLPANTIIGGEGYLVLVEDEVRFQNVHPTITNYIAAFGNSITGNMGLSNGGEWISINNADRSFMDTVHYDDKLPWPEAADGTGPSLQLISAGLDNALPESWIASSITKGTPGEPFQGLLYLGENTVLCSPTQITLDASYQPCINCTYNWSNGVAIATNTITPSLGENIYSVTVTDLGGIIQTDEITITLSEPFSLFHSQVNLDCYEDDNGSIDLSVNNSNNYSYQWTTGSTDQDVNNLTVGSYTVTVTDNLFCSTTEEITITAPPALMPSINLTEIDCYNDLGTIDLSVTGGAAPYTYNWSNAATTQDLSNLEEDIYIVTITDMNSCTIMLDFELEEPEELTGDFDIENGCNGLANGSIDVDMDGGTGSYNYAWSNGVNNSSDDLEDLDAGIYTLTVTDANDCTWVNSAEILVSSSMSSSANISNTTCIGENTGSIDLSISGGIAPYYYAWSTGASSSTINNLIDGDYMVTVTDTIGCLYYETFTISAPNPVLATADITEITCTGTANGSININTSGGTGSYNYAWSNGAPNTNEINNLSNGNYNLTITDGNNCSVTYNYLIAEPNPVNSTVQTTIVACNGEATGSAMALSSGGNGSYSYQWSNNATTAEISNLTAGTYTVTVSDGNNCTTVQTATVTENTILTNTLNQTNINCNDSATGSIHINTNGGQGPYNYLWDNNETGSSLDNLEAGTYTVTISDNNNCTSTETATITQPTAISATIIPSNINCHGGNDGELTAITNGGEAPYSLSWNTGATAEQITNLTADEYSVTITDNNNCSIIQTAIVAEPSAISTSLNTTDVTCNGMDNGQASISSNGGTGTLSYEWNNGETSATINNLAPASYSVTITDISGCSKVESISITQPSALTNSYQTTAISCNNEANGEITLSTSGGTSDYSYQWNTGDTEEELDDLAAGIYTVTINDAQNCSLVESIELVNPSPVTGTSNKTDITCFGETNGSISLTASGGSAPYDFDWSNNASGSAITNLEAGTYIVTISDNNNCTETLSTTINSPNLIEANIEIVAIDCSGSATALIDLSPSGGTGNFSYNWNTGATTADLNNISEGDYTVTITDDNSCSIVENINVSEPSALTTQVVETDINCFGENNGSIELSVAGGEGPYDFSWNTGQTTAFIQNLAVDNYEVTITDNNGCTKLQSFGITEPTSLSYNNFQLFNNNCFGGNNGLISLEGIGGTGDYTYEWNTSDQGNSLTDLTVGTYTLTITDDNNCTFSESFVITEPSSIEITPINQNVSCFNAADGSIEISLSGGTGSYLTNWNTGENTAIIENLQQGTYTVTVTDELACSMIQSFMIEQPEVIEADISADPISCNGALNGAISLDVIGGTAPYQYAWNNGDNGPNPENLGAGDYSVTIIDANDCVQIQFITLSEPSLLEASFGLVNIDCFSDSTGVINSSVQGGVMPYFYEWSTGETTASINNLPAAEYVVTVTDANDCIFTENLTLTEATNIELSSSIVNSVNCFGGNDGAIELVLEGGTPGYEVIWSNGDTGININELTTGTYEASITDGAGCQKFSTFTINEPSELVVTEAFIDASDTNGGSIDLTPTGGTAPYSVLWNNGETIFNLNDLAAGIYNYIVTDGFGCTNIGSISLLNVGINLIDANDLLIYPNPTTGMIFIESDFAAMEIVVLDVLGRVMIQETNFGSGNTEIELSGFGSGIYLLRVKADGKERVERILVE